MPGGVAGAPPIREAPYADFAVTRGQKLFGQTCMFMMSV